MKVCFFAHKSKSYQNGAAMSLINIANEMAERGIEVIIVLPSKNLEYPIDNKKIKIFKVPSFSMRTKIDNKGLKNKTKGMIKSFYNLYSIRKALTILRKEKPDIIHNNGLDSEVGALVAKKLNIPYVWHIRQLLQEDFGMKLHNEKKIYRLLKDANSVIAISQTVKDKFEKIINKEIDLIYNGIPVENYEIKDKKIFADGTINFLLAGRIIEQKGQFDAVKAINHLVKSGNKNLHLTIAGNKEDIVYFSKIKSYITKNELDNYIKIIEPVSDLRQLTKSCDIGLICSKREAFGRVTIETMVSQMLVIGANTGGTAEIIDDNVNGILYQEGDYLSLANRIKYAINHKSEMKAIIDSGYDSAIKKYSISSVVDQIIEVYYKLRA